MLASTRSATLLGVDGRAVTVEVHVGHGLPGFTVVGQPDGVCRRPKAAGQGRGAGGSR